MKIPLVNLKSQYHTIKPEIDTAIQRVLDNGWFIGGEEVEKFEKEFAEYIGTKHCVSVNSGTDALILGFRALGLKPGDEVIIPANTFIATALGVTENGLIPILVDTDINDFGISLQDLRKKISSRTKAVVLVHLYGQADKIDDVKEVIAETGQEIHIVEDACQAHGALYKEQKVGSFGIFSTFSFYPGKNLGAYGDGGSIMTNDDAFAEKFRLLHEYGQREKYHHESVGINSRLDTIQAAILRIKLKHLDEWNTRRKEIAHMYTELIQKSGVDIIVPTVFSDRESVYHLYVIRVNNRDFVLNSLNNEGIGALIHYPVPLHLQKAYEHLNYKKGDFPYTEQLSNEIISLPLYPEISEAAVASCVDALKKYCK